MIAANQQQVRANKQQIQQNLSSIEEHTRRFRVLDDFDVKGLLTTDPIGGNFCLEV